jgi:outer membrane lipoprotein-sorting protein
LPRRVVRAFGIALALTAVTASAAAVDDDAIARVEAYLNAITTLRADFVQIADDGGVSKGTLYIERPGRLRVQYAPPAMVDLVSDGDWLTYTDREVGQVSQMPLSDTPAGVLVREDVRFDGDIVVERVERGAQVLRVTLVRAESPDDGSFTLVFTENPFALRQWVVVDAQGLTTRVTLYDGQHGVALDPELFAAPAPFPDGVETR